MQSGASTAAVSRYGGKPTSALPIGPLWTKNFPVEVPVGHFSPVHGAADRHSAAIWPSFLPASRAPTASPNAIWCLQSALRGSAGSVGGRAGCPLLAAEPRAKLRSAETCPAAQAGIISLGNTRKRCDQTRENVQPNLTNDERTERTDGLGRCRSPKNSTREVVTSALSSRRPKILLQAFICREAHAVRMLHCCYCPAATDAVDNNNSLLPHTASTTSASTTAVVAAATHSFFSRRRRTGFVRDRSGGWHDPA